MSCWHCGRMPRLRHAPRLSVRDFLATNGPASTRGPGLEVSAMKRFQLLSALLIAALGALAAGSAQAAGLERLYILNCGEGMAGDISRWSPGVNVGQSMPFVDNCYLLKHAQGWMLWDTGVADAIAAMPDGQKPTDPKATHWYRPKTLAS